MKKYIFAAFIALAFAPVASAQDWSINGQIKDPKYHTPLEFPHDNGVQTPDGKNFGYSKNISSPFSDGTYWIKLESFATGEASVIDKPSDIVLVLDVSGSMRYNYETVLGFYPYSPSAASSAGFSWSHAGTTNTDRYGGKYSESYVKYNGEFHKVERLREGPSTAYRYYLYFDIGDVRYYLNGKEITTTKPAGQTSQSGAIWWGTLYREKYKSRLDALKEAVKGFIDIIEENDLYFTDKDGNKVRRTDEEGNPTTLGNKISIIKFAHQNFYSTDNLLLEGNHIGAGSNTANYTEVVKVLRSVSEEKQILIDAVDELIEASTTASDKGMQLANEVLKTIDRESNRTVVLFTDGEPNHNDGFDTTVATAAVQQAEISKTTYEATVFSVGVFTNETSNIKSYMNRVSSNYINCTTYQNGTHVSDSYYQNAADGNLTEVFANIAKQAGGSESILSAATSNVDVVSNSFILPEGATADNIEDYVKVFTAPLDHMDDDGNYIFGTETLAGHATDTYDVYNDEGEVIGTYKVDEIPNPSGTSPATLPIHVQLVGTNGIKVVNFDYSNNWCGPVEDQAHNITYHGHKIIIMIPIQMNPDAVGGPNVETNAEGSGIFSKEGDNTPFVEFKSPTVSLPVNIYIEKAGMQGIESGKFLIERAVVPDLPEGQELTEDDIKAIPESAWEFVTSVFVTNSTNSQHAEVSGNPMVKVKGLPATKSVGGEQKGLVYRIREENWSWNYNNSDGYQYTVTGQINNPFTFTNSKDVQLDKSIKHAESKVKNLFKAVENKKIYDDSKANTR